MQRLKLVERAAELEPYVREKLLRIKEKHPSVGDVRGLGLFFAVEIVKNRKTRQLFNTMRDKVEGKPLVVDQIAAKMMARVRQFKLGSATSSSLRRSSSLKKSSTSASPHSTNTSPSPTLSSKPRVRANYELRTRNFELKAGAHPSFAWVGWHDLWEL